MTVESRAKRVFLDALDVDASERSAFVARACGDDDELRARVLALLASHERAPDVLDASAEAPRLGRWVERALDELDVGPGDVVGDYLLERVLGEGGFGRVFLAY